MGKKSPKTRRLMTLDDPDSLWPAPGDTLDPVGKLRADGIAPTVSVEEPFAAKAPASARPEPAKGAGLPRGSIVGRFLVVERLGVGGMGVVYRAYDPQLHRQVAVKLLRPALQDGTESRSRLLREAQAMAQVSHPNVVMIHDVGTLEDRVYIAMELVEGRTLSRWLARKPRSWTEVVETFVQAGRGLAAAHAKDLIHRDFKPENVMMDETGRVRVMDFGLARSSGVRNGSREPGQGEQHKPTLDSGSSLDEPLTREGALMGTPAYMAPEQFNGLPTDARTDQFSFCVAVWEGLYGLRPFSGSGITELMAKVSEGVIADPPAGDVPRALEVLLRRGLRPEPEDRWPNLVELVDALERLVAPRQRSPWVPILATAAMVGAAGLAVVATSEDDKCAGADAAMQSVWHPARADQISGAFGALGKASVGVWSKQQPRIDRYTEAWRTMHRQACEATAVTAEQSGEVLDLRMGCLRRAKVSLDATLTVLAQPDDALAARLPGMLSGLPRIERCGDVESLQDSGERPAPAIAAAVAAALRQVEASNALARAGRFEASLETGKRALAESEAAGYGPAIADATLAVATAHAELTHHELAAPMLLDAQRMAVKHGLWSNAVSATARYVHLVGHAQSRPDEALVVAEFGRAFAARANDPSAELMLRGAITAALTTAERFDEAVVSIEASLEMYAEDPELDRIGRARELDNLANILGDRGDFERALAARKDALETQREATGPDHPTVARQLSNLGATYSMMGRNEEAAASYREALALQERALPDGHIDTVVTRANLGAILASAGNMIEAEVMYRKVLSGLEAKLGQAHPNVIMTRYGLAGVLRDLRKLDEAEVLARQALDDARQALGHRHLRVAGAAAALGGVLLDKGELAEAEALFRTAVDIHTETRGGAHPYTLSARLGLSDTLIKAERISEAEEILRVALEEGLASQGEDVLEVARLRKALAEVLLVRGQAAEARVLLERSRTLLFEASPTTKAETSFALAQALWPDLTERRAALKLARAAQVTFAATPGWEASRGEVDRWLEARKTL